MNKEPHHKEIAVIGYSGHAFVAVDILLSSGYNVTNYCDQERKSLNPYSLEYLGPEHEDRAMQWLKQRAYFIAIGDNAVREKLYRRLSGVISPPVNAIHPSSIIASTVTLQDGIMIAAGAVINPLASIGAGAICNTSSSIDHECVVGSFAHIAPGAILCGNVQVGERTFIGAGAVIRQGIQIGSDVMIGAGCVVVKNVPDNMIMVGNPQKE